MKFLCLGMYDREKMAGRPPEELEALMEQCRPFMRELQATGQLVMEVGVDQQQRAMRREKGKVKPVDGPFMETKELVGGLFIVEAVDMDEATRLAALHPTTRMDVGETLGWRLVIQPIHYFFQPDNSEPA